jgi:hypothetical protein
MTESKLTTWYKPNGTAVQINNAEATIAKAKSLGWAKTKAAAAKNAKK